MGESDGIHRELSERVIGAAIEVHRALGPGLLESAYEACLAHEMLNMAIPFERQVPLPIEYKGELVDCGYHLDSLVDGKIILELKSIDSFASIHDAQLLTYMRLARVRLGLLMNFNVRVLVDGIRRRVL